MDIRSRILIAVFFLLIIGSVGMTYWRFVVKKDYVIATQIECDPYAEKCFIWECDPAAVDEGEKCVGDLEEDVWYYKIVKRNASLIPLCDPEIDKACDPWTCDPAMEKDCQFVLCDEKTKIKYDQEAECNDPAVYAAENPEEEADDETGDGDSECADDNEECLLDFVAGDGGDCEAGDVNCGEDDSEEDLNKETDVEEAEAE